MNSALSTSNWLLWLRNAVILGVLAAAAFWGVAELLAPPVPEVGSSLGVSKAQLNDIQ